MENTGKMTKLKLVLAGFIVLSTFVALIAFLAIATTGEEAIEAIIAASCIVYGFTIFGLLFLWALKQFDKYL